MTNIANSLLLKMVIEIVDLPIKNVIFHSYVSLPEGIWLYKTIIVFGRDGWLLAIFLG